MLIQGLLFDVISSSHRNKFFHCTWTTECITYVLNQLSSITLFFVTIGNENWTTEIRDIDSLNTCTRVCEGMSWEKSKSYNSFTGSPGWNRQTNHTSYRKVYINEFVSNAFRDNIGSKQKINLRPFFSFLIVSDCMVFPDPKFLILKTKKQPHFYLRL